MYSCWKSKCVSILLSSGSKLTFYGFVCFIVFLGYTLEMLNRSTLSLQETFTSTWSSVYSENSQVFSDLFTELTAYYRGANVNLEEVLNDFWAKLLEKLFYQANKQYSIGTFIQH